MKSLIVGAILTFVVVGVLIIWFSLRSKQLVTLPENSSFTAIQLGGEDIQIDQFWIRYTGKAIRGGPVFNDQGGTEPVGTAGYLLHQFQISRKPINQASKDEIFNIAFWAIRFRDPSWSDGSTFKANGMNFALEVHKDAISTGEAEGRTIFIKLVKI